jgi:hypothetical protein
MKSFKVHEDTSFAPSIGPPSKGLKQFGRSNIVLGPENADAAQKKSSKSTGKQPAKFGAKVNKFFFLKKKKNTTQKIQNVLYLGAWECADRGGQSG